MMFILYAKDHGHEAWVPVFITNDAIKAYRHGSEFRYWKVDRVEVRRMETVSSGVQADASGSVVRFTT